MCKISVEYFCLRWRLWIRPLLILFYCLFVIIIVPLLIINSVKDGFTRKDQLILIGGLFVLTSLPISIWHITQHIINYTKPILQKHIIRVLWMVPIYALNAWFGLLFPDQSIYMDSIRECYEAYVIYNFMIYLLNYLNLEMDLEATLQLKPTVKHIFPLCCMQPWEMGNEFIHNCKHGILQYTVVRPFTTFISVICELCGVYGEGNFQGDVAFPYIIAINNLSQFIAMYCLVLFYQANKAELKPMKPLPKFLCIKAVVFFSFFQGVIINILVYFGYIQNIFGSDQDDANDYKNLSSKLQDFLICIEMFLAAIAHSYSFPHYPFHLNIPYYSNSWYNAFAAMLDISDIHQDVTEHLGVVGSSLSRRLRGRSMYHMTRGTINSETDYLIQPNSAPGGCYQSGILYGAASASATNLRNVPNDGKQQLKEKQQQHYEQQDGINIIKNQSVKTNYSPNMVGAPPKAGNLFNFNDINLSTSSTQQTISTTTTSDTDKYNKKTSSSKYYKNNSCSNSNLSANLTVDDQTTASTTTTGGAIGGNNTNNLYNLQSQLINDDDDDDDDDNTGHNLDINYLNIMKKSDSTASDWLSTPTDEIMAIDIRGIENDKITFSNINI